MLVRFAEKTWLISVFLFSMSVSPFTDAANRSCSVSFAGFGPEAFKPDLLADVVTDPVRDALDYLRAREIALGAKAKRDRDSESIKQLRADQRSKLQIVAEQVGPHDQMRVLQKVGSRDTLSYRSILFYSREIRDIHAEKTTFATIKLERLSELYETVKTKYQPVSNKDITGLNDQWVRLETVEKAARKTKKYLGRLEAELAQSETGMGSALKALEEGSGFFKGELNALDSPIGHDLEDLRKTLAHETAVSTLLRTVLQREESRLSQIEEGASRESKRLGRIIQRKLERADRWQNRLGTWFISKLPIPELKLPDLTSTRIGNFREKVPPPVEKDFVFAPDLYHLFDFSVNELRELCWEHEDFRRLISRIEDPNSESALAKRVAMLRDPVSRLEGYLISPNIELRSAPDLKELWFIYSLDNKPKTVRASSILKDGRWQVHFFDSEPGATSDLKAFFSSTGAMSW